MFRLGCNGLFLLFAALIIASKIPTQPESPGEKLVSRLFLIGLFLLILVGTGTWSAIRRWGRQWDCSYLKLKPFPVVLGERLTGVLELPLTWPEATTNRVELICQKTVSKSKGTHSEILWMTEIEVNSMTRTDKRFIIPLDIQTSERAQPTHEEGVADIHWDLIVRSGVSPEDFRAEFPVEVISRASDQDPALGTKSD